MRTLKLVLLAALLIPDSVALAQEYTFKVLAHKGSNEIKTGEEWHPLKTGATLRTGDEVKLGDNSYVGLVHSSGKPVEVKQAGVHKVSELEEKVPTGSSVLNKYTDFILSAADDGQGNRLVATGAVKRETPPAPGTVKVFLPENTPVYGKTVVVNWEERANEGPFVVSVMNMFEDVLVQAETAGNTYTVDLSHPKLAGETAVLIQVSAKGAGRVVSRKHTVKKMAPADYDKIASLLTGISREVNEQSAMDKVLLAGFYEENSLLADAILAFEQAKKIEPGAFDETYNEFLIRHNLK